MSRGRAPRPVRRMGSEVHADTRTQRERERGQSERAAVEAELEAWPVDEAEAKFRERFPVQDVVKIEQWFVEGRVPGGRRAGWSTKVGGPFDTREEAVAWGRDRRLGGLRVWSV